MSSNHLLNNRLLFVTVSLVPFPSASPQGKPMKVMVALFENNLVTSIDGGENKGRTLKNDFVVRAFRTVGELNPKSPHEINLQTDLLWDPGWKEQECGLVVFLQDPQSMKIFDSSVSYPLTSPH